MAKEAPRRFFENQTITQYPPVMAYFDVTKETILTVDASPVGIFRNFVSKYEKP